MAREAINLGVPEKVGEKIRWRKTVKGNRWASPVYDSPSRRNESDAWQEFVAWRADLEQQIAATRTPEQQTLHHAVDLVEMDAEYADMNGKPDKARSTRQLADTIRGMIATKDQPTVAALLAEVLGSTTGERLATVSAARKTRQAKLSAEFVAEKFFEDQRIRARSKEISAGRYGVIRNGVNDFLKFFGRQTDMTSLNNDHVKDYWLSLLKRITKSKENPEPENNNTLADHWQVTKQFLDQISDEYEDIPKPSNLRSKIYKIKRTRREPDPFTKEEFQLIFDNASDKTKLYLILMLNMAAYQGDLAELTADEVDWKAGRIIRPRSKKTKLLASKGIVDEPMKINYLLWPETFRLLKEHGHRDGLVIRNKDGGQLVVSEIGDNDIETRNDNVRSAYVRVITKLKNQKLLPKKWKKTLKQLRKTGPNILDDESEKYGEFVDVLLDHSRVANLAYLKTGKAHKPFDDALAFIGKKFGF